MVISGPQAGGQQEWRNANDVMKCTISQCTINMIFKVKFEGIWFLELDLVKASFPDEKKGMFTNCSKSLNIDLN